MIIDFHTHTFPKKIVVGTIDMLSKKAHMAPSLDGTKEGLLRSMQESGVDLSVEFSVATSSKQVSRLNDIAIANSAKYDKIISFGAMHPECEDYEDELIKLSKAGIKGIKIHPVYQGVCLSDERFLSIFKVCKELDMIVLTHTGLDIGFPGVEMCHPKDASKILEKVDGLKLVLAHMGGWKQWEIVLDILKGTEAYYDTSFATGFINPIPGEGHYNIDELTLMNTYEFTHMIDILGYDKILFGTDSPWSDQSDSIDFIGNLPIENTAKEAILGENAKKLLNL